MKKVILITIIIVVVLGIFIANKMGWEKIDCNIIDASDMGYYAGRCVDGGGKSFDNLIANFILVEIILILVAVAVYKGVWGLIDLVKNKIGKQRELK